MKETVSSYPTSSAKLSPVHSTARTRQDGKRAARYRSDSRSADQPACDTGKVVDVEISTTSLLASITLTKKQIAYYPVENPHGRPLKPPRLGAKGIAGIRADIITGRLTIRELSLMGVTAIMRRYRISKPVAYKCRLHVLQYGIDGKCRTILGERKPLAE